MKKQLIMRFTAGAKLHTISIPTNRDDITKTEVENAMNTLVAQKCVLNSQGVAIDGLKDAKVVTTTEREYEIA